MDRFEKRRQTRNKRKSQICKIYEVKIDRSHLSKITLNHLYSLFREAKWFYNSCLNKNINDIDTTAKFVLVKVKNTMEERKFTALSSQMKQSIKSRIFRNIKSLSTLRKNGYKTGRIKFKSDVNSIPLIQFGNYNRSGTYHINFKNNTIRIQGMKKWMKVNGIERIKNDCEIANANLIKKCDNFYIHITTFENKKLQDKPNDSNNSIGGDFGCETQLTLSNGIKIEFQVPVTDKIKRLDRKIDKKINGKIGKNRGSKNRRKFQNKRRKEYNKLANKKKDIRNKVVSTITKYFKYVCVQDENIHAWHAGGHGKKIQNSAIGGIISDLKHKSHTPIVVNKYFASTQLCPQCGKKNKLEQSGRVYNCDCGFECDRDIKSAQCIHYEGMQQLNKDNLPTDRRNVKPEEILPSAFLDALNNIVGVKISVSKVESMSQEALSCSR